MTFHVQGQQVLMHDEEFDTLDEAVAYCQSLAAGNNAASFTIAAPGINVNVYGSLVEVEA